MVPESSTIPPPPTQSFPERSKGIYAPPFWQKKDCGKYFWNDCFMWILSAPNHRLPTASQQNAGFCGWISSLISCRMFRGFNLPHCRAKNQAKTNLPWLGIMVFQTLPESLQEKVPPSWVWLVVGPRAASKCYSKKVCVTQRNRTSWLIPCFVISENLLLILSLSLANQVFGNQKGFLSENLDKFFLRIDAKQVYFGRLPLLSRFLDYSSITRYCANSLPAFAFPT